ncbi:MAG: hypothetical protein E6G63_07000 [Actinobacteria bacterium]|nr:MAG: hypothetical protein E6G63_07000 [Actinomycetota bacterium]
MRPIQAPAPQRTLGGGPEEVQARFSSWGRRLSDHYREAGGTGRETVEGSQRKLEEAAREIGNEIGRAFTALGETINDDDAKKELKRAVSAIGDAVTVTVSEAGRAVRGRGSFDEQPQRPDQADDEGPASASG